MRTTLDPRLVDPSGHESELVVDVRDERRTLLFDLGEIDRLAPPERDITARLERMNIGGAASLVVPAEYPKSSSRSARTER